MTVNHIFNNTGEKKMIETLQNRSWRVTLCAPSFHWDSEPALTKCRNDSMKSFQNNLNRSFSGHCALLLSPFLQTCAAALPRGFVYSKEVEVDRTKDNTTYSTSCLWKSITATHSKSPRVHLHIFWVFFILLKICSLSV